MPAVTTETVKRREAVVKKAVAALGADADPLKRRKLAKQLRRTQRKRRRLAVMDTKRNRTKPAADAKAE